MAIMGANNHIGSAGPTNLQTETGEVLEKVKNNLAAR